MGAQHAGPSHVRAHAVRTPADVFSVAFCVGQRVAVADVIGALAVHSGGLRTLKPKVNVVRGFALLSATLDTGFIVRHITEWPIP